MILFIYKLFPAMIKSGNLSGFATILKKLQSPHISTGFSLLLYRGVKLSKSSLKATSSTK